MSEDLQKEENQEAALREDIVTDLQPSQKPDAPAAAQAAESAEELQCPAPVPEQSDAAEENKTEDTSEVEIPPEETLPQEMKEEQSAGDDIEEAAQEGPVSVDTTSEVPTEQAEAPRDKKKMVLVTMLLVLAIVMCIGVVSQVLSKGYVSIGGFSLFRVVTGSMEPEIPVGSLLISRRTDIEDIQVDDIVNYRSQTPGMLGVVITHRVIAIHEDSTGQRYLETKGDANQYADGAYVEEENLIGRVTFYTKAGNIIAGFFTFLTSSVGFLACIVLPCLVIGLMTIQDCIRSMQSELDKINQQLKLAEQETSQELDLTSEEYQELYNKLRDELLEELKQGAEEQTE